MAGPESEWHMTGPRIRPSYAGLVVAAVATVMLAFWIIVIRSL
jgi:hypothetical protein